MSATEATAPSGSVTPTISVLTALGPSVSDHLGEAADSVLGQQMTGTTTFEWIVCVDGPQACADLPDDDRIRVVAAGRAGGPALCRNVAAAHAAAPLLRNLDADDVLLPGALADDVAALADTRYGWSTSAALDLLPDGRTRTFGGDRTDREVPLGAIAEQWRDSDVLDVHVTTLVVRREVFWAAGGYTALPRSEDVALLARLNTDHVGLHRSRPGLLYRKWPGQITATPRDSTNRKVRERISGSLTS